VVRPPGSEVTLTVNSWGGDVPRGELEGDFLRTAAGSCYRIVEWRPSRAGSRSLGRFRCVKLDRDAVQDGEPGVWRWEFGSR
jgi:hypothetical protein